MACNPMNGGIPKDCDNNLGGVSKVYITDFENVTGNTTVSGEITAFTMASGTVFYEFEFNKNVCNFTEVATVSLENGSLFYAQTLTLVIPRREVSKREKIALLMQKDLAVIVKDANGLFWYMGEVNGANVTNIEGNSGTVKADGSKYTITILAEEIEQAKEVDPAAVAAVI